MAGPGTCSEAGARKLAEWGVAGMTMPGCGVSGDLEVVAPAPLGLVAGLIDGLGHGSEAAGAARIAADTIRARSAGPVEDIFLACHEALQATRGAVIGLASLDGARGALDWLCVGNISGRLIRYGSGDHERLLQRGGVVGYRLPTLKPRTIPVGPGDLLIFMTDGVRDDLAGMDPCSPAQRMAEGILRRGARGNDDARVLVVRWKGSPPPGLQGQRSSGLVRGRPPPRFHAARSKP